MMQKFTINGDVWKWNGSQGSWHFIYIDNKNGKKIKESQRGLGRRGFGAVKVKATLGRTSWTTSIFPTKEGPYLLPIKAMVRKEESVFDGDKVKIICELI